MVYYSAPSPGDRGFGLHREEVARQRHQEEIERERKRELEARVELQVRARVESLAWWVRIRRRKRRQFERQFRAEIRRALREERERQEATEEPEQEAVPQQDFEAPQRRKQTVSAGLDPQFNRLLRANERRLAALEAEDVGLARSALREVVADLDVVLDSAAEYLMQSDNRRASDRERIKKIVKGDLAVSTAAALPLADIADLLDMSQEQVEAALRSVRARGEVDRSTRDEALRQIEHLRALLRIVEEDEDHVLLDGLFAVIIKIAQVLAIAVTATVIGTVAIGEHLIDTMVLKTAIIALVTGVLLSAVAAIEQRQSKHNAKAVSHGALVDLNTELASFIESLRAKSAYAHEWPVGRIRLLVKTYKAQQALIEIKWKDKADCWNTLGDLSLHIQSSDVHPDRLSQLMRRLRVEQDRIQSV